MIPYVQYSTCNIWQQLYDFFFPARSYFLISPELESYGEYAFALHIPVFKNELAL